VHRWRGVARHAVRGYRGGAGVSFFRGNTVVCAGSRDRSMSAKTGEQVARVREQVRKFHVGDLIPIRRETQRSSRSALVTLLNSEGPKEPGPMVVLSLRLWCYGMAVVVRGERFVSSWNSLSRSGS